MEHFQNDFETIYGVFLNPVDIVTHYCFIYILDLHTAVHVCTLA